MGKGSCMGDPGNTAQLCFSKGLEGTVDRYLCVFGGGGCECSQQRLPQFIEGCCFLQASQSPRSAPGGVPEHLSRQTQSVSARWVIVMVIIPVTGLCSVAFSGEPKRRVLNRNGSDPTVARPSVWRGNADLSNPTLGTAVPRWFPGTNRLSV